MQPEQSLNPTPKRVVIVGGGFAGINVAKQLGNRAECQVTVIDRCNHHLFQPLLYQVAMAGLDPSDIASPIRSMLRDYRNTRVLLAEVTQVDTEGKRVLCGDDAVPYDVLVLATGSMHDYFGHHEWEAHAPGLKTISQATEIRRRVLWAFEQAEKTSDPLEQQEWLTFVIVGGGPTGVELAGAIAEMARKTLRRDFKSIDMDLARVILIQGGKRVLEQFPESLSDYGKTALEKLGVEVWLDSLVKDVDEDGVLVDGRRLSARTILWAAGVKASSLGSDLHANRDAAGRVSVNADLTVPGCPDVYVIGDLAAAKGKDGKNLPGLAPVAVQQGRYVGRQILKSLRSGQPTQKAFRFKDKGQMATIGRRCAVLQSGRFKATGTMAWLGWLLIHIAYLNGFRNRLFVFLSWTYSYLTYGRGARLIVPKSWRISPEDVNAQVAAPTNLPQDAPSLHQ